MACTDHTYVATEKKRNIFARQQSRFLRETAMSLKRTTVNVTAD